MKNPALRYLCSLAALALLPGPAAQRCSAEPLTSGNIVVTTQLFTGPNNTFLEFTPSGVEVQRSEVPYPGGRPSLEALRDAVVTPDGRIHMYNGTSSPVLTSLDPATGTFVHNPGVGFSTIGNLTFGGIAAFQNFIYVTDMNSPFSPDSGIVRFDLNTGTSRRFALGTNHHDLSIGRDGLLYALGNGGVPPGQIYVYDPVTMNLLRIISLFSGLIPASIRGIAADSDGTLYGAALNGQIYHISQDGGPLRTLYSGVDSLTDIDLSADGRLVVGNRFGTVVLTDVSFSSPTSFEVGSVPVRVAFVGPLTVSAVPEPSSLALLTLGVAALSVFVVPRRNKMQVPEDRPPPLPGSKVSRGI